jgi:hydroxyethylthiazole kinase-like sugar kinase family protein
VNSSSPTVLDEVTASYSRTRRRYMTSLAE